MSRKKPKPATLSDLAAGFEGIVPFASPEAPPPPPEPPPEPEPPEPAITPEPEPPALLPRSAAVDEAVACLKEPAHPAPPPSSIPDWQLTVDERLALHGFDRREVAYRAMNLVRPHPGWMVDSITWADPIKVMFMHPDRKQGVVVAGNLAGFPDEAFKADFDKAFAVLEPH